MAFTASSEPLEQALINLLRNAVEALDETAAPRIAVRMRAVAGEVVIEVIDNGRGLSDEVARRVLTLFFTTKQGGAVFAMNLPAARFLSGTAPN